VLGRELDVDALYSDDRHSLINRLCKQHYIPEEHRSVLLENITSSLQRMIKKETVAPSLLDTVLGFFHKEPIIYDKEIIQRI
jgi:hypothetical protein